MATSKERERELARKRYERQQQRRAQQLHARRTGAVIASVVAVLLVIGVVVALSVVGKSNKSGTASKLTTTTSAGASASPSASAAAGQCQYTKSQAPASRDVGLPPATPGKTASTVTLSTNQGAITLDLDPAKAPCTTNSFTYLVSKKYFDGTSCHRLTTSGIFVLQCGDPSGTGSGGPGYQFQDENLGAFGGQAGQQTPVTYPAGTVAMANAGPGTNGSQFFLVYKNSPLPPAYTPFGKITKGLDVLKKVAAAGSDNSNGKGDGHPKQKVTITKAMLVQ